MKLTPREQQLLDFLKSHAGRTIQFETIRESFAGSETRNFHKSLMCSVRRLRTKLLPKGNILHRVTKVGRGHKAAFFIDETILKL